LVYHDIKSKQLKAVASVWDLHLKSIAHERLNAEDGLDYNFLDFLENRFVIDVVCLQHFTEASQAPLRPLDVVGGI
jgi:hypothetical protein